MKLVTQLDFLKVAVKENIKDNGKVCDVWLDGQNVSTFPNKTECVLMQFVNYTTKIGQEVYECDVLKPKNSLLYFVILWNKEKSCFSLFGNYDINFVNKQDELCIINSLYNKNSINVDFMNEHEFDVVGNIFENPELICENFNPIDFIYQ